MKIPYKACALLTIVFLLPAAAWFMVFSPALSRIDSARTELQTRHTKLQVVEETIAKRIEPITHDVETLEKVVADFEAQIPARRQVEGVLKTVTELAQRHGLIPTSVNTEPEITAERHAEIPLQMKLRGDFGGFYRFLIELEQLKRLTRIKQMEVRQVTNDDAGQVEVSLTLSIFFVPKPSDPAMQGSPVARK